MPLNWPNNSDYVGLEKPDLIGKCLRNNENNFHMVSRCEEKEDREHRIYVQPLNLHN